MNLEKQQLDDAFRDEIVKQEEDQLLHGPGTTLWEGVGARRRGAGGGHRKQALQRLLPMATPSPPPASASELDAMLEAEQDAQKKTSSFHTSSPFFFI